MPSIYCGMCFTIFIYCCTPFPFVFQSVILFFTIFTFSHFSLLKCYLPLLCSFFPFIHSPCFFTSKAVIFYTKTVIFISDSMTTISYLCSSPSLHFYIVFLVEEHIKAVILISKLFECRFVFFVTSDNTKSTSIACRKGGRAHYNCSFYLKTPRRRWKKTLKL
ncbi:hypothetical protein JHK84_052039 [Glycine max]|nr:hypothetical protein JHK85_052851 [Glycine max]KAG5082001.1 hypothetical protein JHK84_052039 [Glycine max]